MRSRLSPFLLAALVCVSPLATAAVVTFEHATLPGIGMAVIPTDPYAEAGLTLLPATSAGGILSATNTFVTMPGNTTDWFQFYPTNRITFVPTFGNGTFHLSSLRLGPTSLGAVPSVNVDIVGHRADGSVLSQTFSGVDSIKTVNLGWSDLKRVEISADEVLGLDDIEATVEPLPPLPPGHAVLRFEDVATPGRTANPADNVLYVDPDSPYRESGYRIVTSVPRSGGVTDGTSTTNLVGEATDFLGFTADNSLTLTRDEGDGVFDLDALEAGPLKLEFFSYPPADVTLTGTLSDGSTVTQTFESLYIATRLVVGWKGLTSVLVTSTQYAGIDNVEVSAVPEPSVWMSLAGGLGVVSLAVARKKHRRV